MSETYGGLDGRTDGQADGRYIGIGITIVPPNFLCGGITNTYLWKSQIEYLKM